MKRKQATHSPQYGTRRKQFATVACAALAGFVMAHVPTRANDGTSRFATETSAQCSRSGAVWWNELLAPDTDKLTDFYAKVIGWKPKVVDVENNAKPAKSPNDRYTIFMDGDSEAAGLMKANHPDAVHTGVGWFTYIQVADVEVAVEKAQAMGGTVLREPAEGADGNVIAVVSDPLGNVFGLVTPGKKGAC